MAPRTSQTKGKSKSKAKTNPQVLSEEKWRSMKPFGSFVVPDPDGGEGHKFSKEDTASILPHTITPGTDIDDSQYWIGKIRDIRAEIHEDGTNNVNVKVQWFYSGKDVANVVKSFDPSSVGEYERIISDHYDILDPLCFNASTPVISFNENDPEPPFIPREAFFQRYDLEYKARSIKPKPGSSSCICNVPYNPSDISPSSLMHFCPRPSCRRAYHHRCLVAAKSKESSTALPLVDGAGTASSSKNYEEDEGEEQEEQEEEEVIVSNPSPTRKHSRATRSNIPPNGSDMIMVSPSKTTANSNSKTKRTRSQKNSEEKGKANKKQDQESRSHDLSPDNPLYSRAFRLLTCSPDTDENVDLACLIPLVAVSQSGGGSISIPVDLEENQPPKKKQRSARKSTSNSTSTAKSKGKSKSQNVMAVDNEDAMDVDTGTQVSIETELKPSRTLADALGSVPFDLLKIAEQPMVRGGAFMNGGVSGNVAFVVRARRLVYRIVEGHSMDSLVRENGGWEEVVFGGEEDGEQQTGKPGMENAIVKIGKSKKPLLPFVCPECKSAI